ncbi:hypothetical protein [Ferrovibrio sp.]|uniref:Cap15 family cyclic dinucleotide receptor domain-containing protein n=1 Tax=Ferrovibrio sp. TaxID=1917215 RepID=UPI000CB5B889|nr:hypothetical protein [Ferrovibrio sp.]PJI38974.1 MAG: hypothetical protein CTR53_13715 [Ferrovibrio sp.]
MWALVPKWWQVCIIVACTLLLALAVEAALQWGGGEALSPWRLVSLITSIIIVGLGGAARLFWRTLWRWFPKLNRWVFPDLNGVWTGKLVSTWADPVTKASPPPIDCTITIRQALFDINVSLKTGESRSSSSRESLQAFRDTGCYRIWYGYHNNPQASVGHRSQPHDGMAWLQVDLDENPNRLTGLYYTSRKTTGDIDVTRQDDGRLNKDIPLT